MPAGWSNKQNVEWMGNQMPEELIKFASELVAGQIVIYLFMTFLFTLATCLTGWKERAVRLFPQNPDIVMIGIMVLWDVSDNVSLVMEFLYYGTIFTK
jgi:hypothetical protein